MKMGALSQIPQSTEGDFYETYCVQLHAYLAGDGEEALSQAYELGRQAMLAGFGLIDLVEVHHAALGALGPPSPMEPVNQVHEARVFLEECLSPFELTHRGYRDAVGLAHHMTYFTSVACHEIKAPLSAILSSAGLLGDMLKVKGNSTEGRLIANVLNGVKILNARANEMMDMAALYAGILRSNPQQVNSEQFLYMVVDNLTPEVERHHMKLQLEIAEKLPQAVFDPDRIQQVITNLTQNAIKYASDGGMILIQANADRAMLKIRVLDFGRGLSQERLLWLSSTASTSNRDKSASGTGLGLMLCKQIMETHKGRLTANNREGNGAQFELTLPITTQRAAY